MNRLLALASEARNVAIRHARRNEFSRAMHFEALAEFYERSAAVEQLRLLKRLVRGVVANDVVEIREAS